MVTGSRPTHRLRVRADGRCSVRATLRAANAPTPPDVGDIRTDDSTLARKYIRDTRAAAMAALVKKMETDDQFEMFVRWSFPDEAFDTFEAWLEAQQTDDTEQAISDLWRGGGQWMIYGLALLLRVQIFVHTVDIDTNELSGPNGGTELVDAREAEAGGIVHLAAMRGEDGQYDHFDVLLDGSTIEEGMEPLGQRRRPSSPARHLIRPRGSALATSHPSGHRGARLVAWAALNVLALAICLNVPPAANTGEPMSIRLAQVAQQVLQQATHLFDSSGPGAFDPSSAAWVHANLQNEPLASSMALSIIPSHLAMPQVPEVVVM